MRVGIVALLQESNTFIRGRTSIAHFADDLLATGAAVREKLAGAHHEVGGFFEGLAEQGAEAVPVFAARTLPYGVLEREAAAELVRRMTSALDAAGRLDGVLVAPHGATVAEGWPDFDGHWLGLLRARVGEGVPIIGTVDPHANLSAAMVAACDALTAYRTNPHLDQRARGVEAARLIGRTLRGEVRPTMAAAYLPMAVNIAAQATAEEPCRSLYDVADQMLGRAGILSNSLVLGFPYADVAEMGAATVAVADGDAALARSLANELAREWWARRAEFSPRLTGITEAVLSAGNGAVVEANPPGGSMTRGSDGASPSQTERPVCLLDMGDNVGGGSPGDGTWIARELLAHEVGPALVCLADAEAAAAAVAAGVGGRLRLAMGGKADPERHGPPIVADVVVRAVTDGRFEEPNPRHGGFTTFDQGATAVVEVVSGNLTVMLTTRRMAPFSLRQLTHAGVDLATFRAVVAKGVHAPVAAYAPVCPTMIRVDTPGVTSADLSRLTYVNRQRPMYPFEPEARFS